MVGELATCPSGFVTNGRTDDPAWPGGEVAWMVVALTTVTFVAAGPLKETVAPLTKLEPVNVTTVPPAGGPEVGLMLVMAGAGPRYLKPLGREPDSPLGLVTVTLTEPIALPAGVV